MLCALEPVQIDRFFHTLVGPPEEKGKTIEDIFGFVGVEENWQELRSYVVTQYSTPAHSLGKHTGT